MLLPVQANVRAFSVHHRSVLSLGQIKSQETEDEKISYPRESFLRDHAFFIQPSGPSLSGQDPVTLQSRVSDLEAEVVRLREQLGTAKGVNDAMWETVVQRVLKGKEIDDPSIIALDVDEAARSKKRGRT